MGRQYGGLRRIRKARPPGYPIWHGSGADYTGFLFHCYSRPEPYSSRERRLLSTAAKTAAMTESAISAAPRGRRSDPP
jgi:hypothetical protein